MQAPEPHRDKLGHRTAPEPYQPLAALTLKAARLILELSPTAMAKALGMSRRQWLTYELGEDVPKLQLKLALTMLLILHHPRGRGLGQELITELIAGQRN